MNMKPFTLAVCFALLLTADHVRDPKAAAVAQDMMKAMGGLEAWNAAHFVRYDFKVTAGGKVVEDRSHLWDKMTGRYRLEFRTKAGKPEIVLFNMGTKEGTAYVDGKKLEGPAAKKAVTDAYEAFINDMYWLAMPWKWMDSGVNLKYAGVKNSGNEACDVVELTFDHVGLTPGDKYNAYVSQKSHLMIHWEYKLQGGDKGAWDWQYGDYGGVKLASNHTMADKTSIDMGQVRVWNKVDDAFFTDPTRSIAQLN